MIGKRLRGLHDESGIAMLLALSLTVLLSVVAMTLVTFVTDEGTRSRTAAKSDGAYQAAEAGFNSYISNLSENPGFYSSFLAKGEATRSVGATTYTSDPNTNVSWTLPATTTWTYATAITSNNTTQPWRPLGNGYEYLIKVYPITSQEVRIVAIGRPTNSVTLSDYRSIETIARSLSVSDFQMLSASDVSYGAGATTAGMVYAGVDNAGNKHNISHNGTSASGDLLAEGTISGSVAMVAPASKYTPSTSPSIRSKIRNQVLFSDLTASPLLTAFPAKAQAGMSASPQTGIYLNPGSGPPDAWWFQFQAGGTVVVQSCIKANNGGSPPTYYPVEYRLPTCTAYATYTLSSGNEDIYVGQDAIVSGAVNARVTLYSGRNIIIGDNISYVTPGSNVLGLIASTNVIIPCWVPPANLSWRASTVALNGVWASDWDASLFSPNCTGAAHTSMTFTGSTAAYGTGGAFGSKTGSMGGFTTRTYNYDSTLSYLIPPDFPRIGSQYTIEVQREVKPG
jgi:hypothetical protein